MSAMTVNDYGPPTDQTYLESMAIEFGNRALAIMREPPATVTNDPQGRAGRLVIAMRLATCASILVELSEAGLVELVDSSFISASDSVSGP